MRISLKAQTTRRRRKRRSRCTPTSRPAEGEGEAAACRASGGEREEEEKEEPKASAGGTPAEDEMSGVTDVSSLLDGRELARVLLKPVIDAPDLMTAIVKTARLALDDERFEAEQPHVVHFDATMPALEPAFSSLLSESRSSTASAASQWRRGRSSRGARGSPSFRWSFKRAHWSRRRNWSSRSRPLTSWCPASSLVFAQWARACHSPTTARLRVYRRLPAAPPAAEERPTTHPRLDRARLGDRRPAPN